MARLWCLCLLSIICALGNSKDKNEVSFFGESFLLNPLRDTSSSTWISLEFYTHLPHGLLFLAAGDTDYVMIQLSGGKLETRVKIGPEEDVMLSSKGAGLNNYRWHSVILNRTSNVVSLMVDGSNQGETTLPGSNHHLNIDLGVYLGGPGNLKKDFISHSKPFRGCIREVYYNDENILEGMKNSLENVQLILWQCADEFKVTSDLPISFSHNESYVAFPHFRMGSNNHGTISMELKTRSNDSILLFNSGLGRTSHHFIAMELIGGKPKLSFDLGSGTVLEITTGFFISDGRWHLLEVLISQTFVQLAIDDVRNTSNLFSPPNNPSMTGHLFIGGLGDRAHQHAVQLGLITHEDIDKKPFLGCVRNIKMNSFNLGYRHIQISRHLSIGCHWEFPCAKDPCILNAQCTELNGSDYRCDCDNKVCVKEEFQTVDSLELQNLNGLLTAGNLEVYEKGSALLGTNVIKINQDILKSSVREESIVFFTKEPPNEGFLEVRRRPNQNTFTFKDFNENNVYYRHQGGNSKQDSITFELSFTLLSKESGSAPDNFNFVLPITIVSQPKLEIFLKNGPILNITSGSSLRITPSILNVKSSAVDPGLLRFTFVFLRKTPSIFESSDVPRKSIMTFTLKDVQDGLIWFRHKEDNTVYTKVIVTDGVSNSSAVDLRFKVEELKLFVLNKTGIFINYGSSNLITVANLSTATNVPLEELEIRYNISQLPKHGSIQRLEHSTAQWTNVTTFTQRHIDSGRIRYQHFPRNIAMHDSFTFDVSAKQLKTEPSAFKVTFTAVTLTVEQNQNLLLNHAHYGKITNNTLLVVTGSDDFHPKNMQYMLIRPPEYGSIFYIKTNIDNYIPFDKHEGLQVDSSFTQEDVNNGFIYYKLGKPTHEKKTDYTDLQASYFGFNIMVRAIMEYLPDQLAVRFVNNGLNDVPEGGSAVIKRQDLSVEMDSSKNFKFVIVSGPMHGAVNIQDPTSSAIMSYNITAFTMSDILEGKIVYSHDDSEHKLDLFTFLIKSLKQDSEQSMAEEFQEFSGTFHIVIKMKNDNPPIRAVNKVFQVATGQSKRLTIDDLAFRDPDIDFDDSKLTYQRQVIPNGDIISANTKEPVYNFSQSDLVKGQLIFRHRGDAYARVPISVSDGTFFTSSLFVIHASSPFLKVVNNTGVDVKQGSHVTLTSFNLSLETNLNMNPDMISFRMAEAPKHGALRIDGRNTIEFRYQDLLNNRVRYWHNGGTSTDDKVIFIVQLETLQTRVSFSFRMTSEGVSDPPEIIHNQILRVTAMQSETISENHLNVAHTNFPPHEIEFIITQLPGFGHLIIKGNPIKMGNVPEFSQQDIIDGQVVYASDTSDAMSDKFVFDVGTELQSLRQLDFLIEIVPQTLQMNRVNGTVREGGTLILATSLLHLKPQLPISARAVLTVSQAPVHGQVILRNGNRDNQVSSFTYEDVTRNRVVYVHDNSESLSDELAIKVDNQEGKVPSRMIVILIEVTPVDDQPPSIVTNTGLDLWTGSLQLLTNKQLMASDPDTSSDHIEFRVSPPPSNGHLAYLNNTFKQIVKFTQKDLDSGLIVFVHKGIETGTFTFKVTDGINSDQSRVFQIRARPVQLTVVANSTIKAFPGFTQPITNASISVKTSSSNYTPPIVFTVLESWPRKGKLVTIIKQKTVEITSFTQSDINEGKIFYKHTSEARNWTDTDMIYFEITTAYAQPLTSKALKVEISFSHINENNYQQLLRIKHIYIKEGGKVTVDKEYFDSTEFVARLRSFLPVVDVAFSFQLPPKHGYLWFDGVAAEAGEVFTQDNLTNGLLMYKHDNTETIRDMYKFAVKIIVPRAYGGHTNAEQVFKMDIFIEPVNDRGFELLTRYPKITVRQGSEAVIMPHSLTTVDMDSGPEEIRYIIVKQPTNGILVKLPDTRTRIDSFSQKDINDKKIVFKHNGIRKSSDSLYFKVWDGLFDPHFSNLAIDVELLTINVAKDSYVPLIQGSKSVIVTNKHLKVSTNGDYNALTYRLIQLPQFGKLMKLSAPALEFSQADIDKGFITYNQNRDSPGDDYFTCSMRLKNIDCTHEETGFDITMKPLIKQSPLVTSAGSYVAITRSSLDASELAHLTNDNPRFDVSMYPLYGKIMRRHRQRREATLENHFQTVTSFTFEDVLYTKIYYVANNNSGHNGTDNFIYVLSARGVPSAKGELIIHLNEPTFTPRDKDEEKVAPRNENQDETKAPSGGKNVSQDSVVDAGASIDGDNSVVVIATVLSLIFILIVAIALIVLFLKWRKRRQPMSVHETKAAKPRPYISGPLQLEQPHVHIEPHDGLVSPGSRESAALVGGIYGAESEYINTSHVGTCNDTDSLHQLKKGSPGSPDIMRVDVSYATPVRKTFSAQDSQSEQATEESDRPSTRASGGRESNASNDLMDWSLMEPDLLQHCHTTTPVLRNNQYWL